MSDQRIAKRCAGARRPLHDAGTAAQANASGNIAADRKHGTREPKITSFRELRANLEGHGRAVDIERSGKVYLTLRTVGLSRHYIADTPSLNWRAVATYL